MISAGGWPRTACPGGNRPHNVFLSAGCFGCILFSWKSSSFWLGFICKTPLLYRKGNLFHDISCGFAGKDHAIRGKDHAIRGGDVGLCRRWTHIRIPLRPHPQSGNGACILVALNQVLEPARRGALLPYTHSYCNPSCSDRACSHWYPMGYSSYVP